MSDSNKDESVSDTSLELVKDDDKCDNLAENSENHGSSPVQFSDHDEDKTPVKPARAFTKEIADPVKVLQLSQCYVADTLEDDDEDGSIMIPPTQSDDTAPFIIPSTPEKGDSVLMDESVSILEGEKKEDGKDEEDIWNKPTQRLIPLEDEVQESDDENDENATFVDSSVLLDDLYDAPTQKIIRSPEKDSAVSLKPEENHNGNAEKDDDDDEWNLRLTETQATQADDMNDDGELKDQDATLNAETQPMDIDKKDDNVDGKPRYSDQSNTDEQGADVQEAQNKTVSETVDTDDDEIEPSQPPSSKTIDSNHEPEHVSTENFPSMKDSSLNSAKESYSSENKNHQVEREETLLPIEKAAISDPDAKEVCLQEKEAEKTDLPNELKLSSSHLSSSDDVLQEEKMVLQNKEPETQNLPDISVLASKDNESEDLKSSSSSEVESTLSQMLPPPATSKPLRWSHTPRRKTNIQTEKSNDVTPAKLEYKSDDDKEVKTKTESWSGVFPNLKRSLGSYNDEEHLTGLLKSVGIAINSERLKSVMSTPKSSSEKVIFERSVTITHQIVERNNVLSEELIVPNEEDKGFTPHLMQQYSPISSSTTSTKNSSLISTPTPGEMGDISCSTSSKSAISSGSSSHIDGRTLGTQTLLSQASSDAPDIKTSTQKDGALSFGNITLFKLDAIANKDSSQDDFQDPSPLIKLERNISESANVNTKTKQAKNTRKRPAKKYVTASETSDESKVFSKKMAKGESLPEIDTEVKKTPKKPPTETRKRGRKKAMETLEKKEEKPIFQVPVIEEDSSSNPAPFGNIMPGVRVMARWKDGYYYSGVVQCEEADGRWRVQFEDEATRIVSRENMLKISILQIGTQVMAMSSDNFYDPGIIHSHYKDGNEFGYIVEQESGVTQRYPRRSVILSAEQVKMITDNRPVAPASLTINLEYNIIGGKRKRKSSQNPDLETSVSPKSSRSSRRRQPADSNLDMTESSANESVVPEKIIVEKVKNEMKEESEAKKTKSEEKKLPSSPVRKQERKGRGGRGKSKKMKAPRNNRGKSVESPDADEMSSSTDATNQESGDQEDSTETESSKDSSVPRPNRIFADCAFLLSHAPRTDDEEDPTVKPFDKEHLCRMIMGCSGQVLDSFEEAQKCGKKIFLLANTYLRTKKYIQCVAANIPCIKHQWLQLSSYASRFLNYHGYFLPTGYSLIKEKEIQWHGKTNIFTDLRILVTSEKKSEFVDIWVSVLLAAKAELVQKYKLPSFTVPGKAFNVNLIVTDATCSGQILSAAKRRKIPIVSSEWVIQSVITGEKLPYDGHPKFKHDHRE